MNKKKNIVMGILLALLLMGCSNQNTDSKNSEVSSDSLVGPIVNPMTETTLDEINKFYPVTLTGEMKEVTCFFIKSEQEEQVAQINFVYENENYTYRIQSTSEEKDISGMYYEWSEVTAVKIGSIDGTVSDTKNEAGIVNWYDAAPGLMYSISMESGASKEKLEKMANLLYQPAQGDVS